MKMNERKREREGEKKRESEETYVKRDLYVFWKLKLRSCFEE